MKKKLSIIAIVAIAIAASWNYQQNKSDIKLSDLALENIDALASGESIADLITENCVWSQGGQCTFTWNGRIYTNSNMKNKSRP